ncbi:hypothetical protein, partial [Pedobacter panaciterrae]|uniref:hypothetical protein n=1 Tax=Pedobacter panaciterrae TaxID=363849 RepID=UPI001C209281
QQVKIRLILYLKIPQKVKQGRQKRLLTLYIYYMRNHIKFYTIYSIHNIRYNTPSPDTLHQKALQTKKCRSESLEGR